MRTIIIAEAGVNHNGNIETAKKLIKKAAEAGADFVKFQTFKADSLVSKKAKKIQKSKIKARMDIFLFKKTIHIILTNEKKNNS